jgi:hypothetical protein
MANDLLQQGIAALRAGNKAQARQLLARAIQEDPRNEQAWLWLSGTVDNDEERLECLNRVLAIDPNNEMAQRGLATLRQKQPSQPSASAPSQTAPRTIPDPAVTQLRPAIETAQALSTAGPTCAACGAEIPQGQEVVVRGKDKKSPAQDHLSELCNHPRNNVRGRDRKAQPVGSVGSRPQRCGHLCSGVVFVRRSHALSDRVRRCGGWVIDRRGCEIRSRRQTRDHPAIHQRRDRAACHGNQRVPHHSLLCRAGPGRRGLHGYSPHTSGRTDAEVDRREHQERSTHTSLLGDRGMGSLRHPRQTAPAEGLMRGQLGPFSQTDQRGG